MYKPIMSPIGCFAGAVNTTCTECQILLFRLARKDFWLSRLGLNRAATSLVEASASLAVVFSALFKVSGQFFRGSDLRYTVPISSL